MIYYLSGGDPTKIKMLRNTNLEDLYKYYYLKRITQINIMLDDIAYAEHLSSLEKKIKWQTIIEK